MLPVRRSNWLPGIFNDFFGNEWIERQNSTSPAVNIIETDKEFKVEIAAPGLTKKDFRIDVHDDNHLMVTVEKESQTEDSGHKYLRREFVRSSFCQSLIFPDNVDKDNIKAKMENGVLVIELPKVAKQEKEHVAKQIEIS
ncbi:MAG: Hsp20/alpha crystallin family protein [Bacteroidales bacterium]|nr:Hsp20/alpha crystallin family protein [Bacteroidales bacterium]